VILLNLYKKFDDKNEALKTEKALIAFLHGLAFYIKNKVLKCEEDALYEGTLLSEVFLTIVALFTTNAYLLMPRLHLHICFIERKSLPIKN
jgi:hypothetical protein